LHKTIKSVSGEQTCEGYAPPKKILNGWNLMTFFWGERKRNFHQNFEYLSPFDDFSTSQEERGEKKTLSLDLCYACFRLVMGPYKPKTCTTRPKLCLGTTRHILDGKLGSQV
jgi:hypothetical protein